MTDQELSAVAWIALERAASKECRRETLAEGAAHEVDLRVDGTIDEEPFVRSIHGSLVVGHAGVRASSAAPDASHLLGLILGKLSRAVRERLLADLPEKFAELGGLPEVPAERVAEAKNLLDRLRTKRQIGVRAPISLSYTVARP